jgi:CTP:molybdopterin cytidylyltransferase MocA
VADGNQDIASVVVAVPPARPEAVFEGRPVLEVVLAAVAEFSLAEPTVTVFNRATEVLVESIDLGSGVAVVDEDGSSWASALSVGLDAATRLFVDAVAVLVVDCDVPIVPTGTVPALIASLRTSGKMAAAPTYRYVRGGPVLLGRGLWDRVMSSESDQRLEEWLAAHPGWSDPVVISEPAPFTVT